MNRKRPLVWLLLGDRLGDNAQVRSLAQRLGYQSEEKYLRFNGLYRIPNLMKGTSLGSLQSSASSPLAPPWPDLVILSGRKSVPVARWIKRQTQGRTRLVTIGRPRVALHHFDLVVTTPQYRLPKAENVVELMIPMSGVRDEDITFARDHWAHLVKDLPAPRIALLVGGDTSTCKIDAAAADRLGRLASSYANARGGSLLVTTSPRTTSRAADALINAITAPSHIHRWRPGGTSPNPYLGFIALADEVIVTCDSASMISDAAAAAKPVMLYEVPMAPRNAVIAMQHHLYVRAEREDGRARPPAAWSRWLNRLAYHGLLTPPRNMMRLYADVVAAGQAAWLVDVCVAGCDALPQVPDGLTSGADEAVSRIRAMLAGDGLETDPGSGSLQAESPKR